MASLFTFGISNISFLLILVKFYIYFGIFDTENPSHYIVDTSEIFNPLSHSCFHFDRYEQFCGHGCTATGFDGRHPAVDSYTGSIRHNLFRLTLEIYWARPAGISPFRPRKTGLDSLTMQYFCRHTAAAVWKRREKSRAGITTAGNSNVTCQPKCPLSSRQIRAFTFHNCR